MSDMTLQDISAAMKKLDICMLSTHAENGEISGRPMSNNGEVEYGGTAYFFTEGDHRMVAEIEANPKVAQGYQSDDLYIQVQGHANLVRDKAQFQEHWNPDLDKWFPEGIDTPDLVMIEIAGQRITYWAGRDEGEIKL
ncbi:pyridoxamine 5'-phosphate oxidase family protein [Deinococcus radiophilus]|uniref:Pyridoxamine 5'-phosphate oxidase n=1 Tax=Deinococcus radiophilus TaxID=32062 RepID=A0A3S0I905_9DEIO|nr:pyridoxamine 5'-phosphate oxidase family protein [Deinococcus radiophilus]RTR28009.1 pyridoxamine 5'-phosphate oxidase [Deinococcus radiophilus]UFA51542.1 pyridoxamine 5'-phosphate oxidase family protein [Deinococcus radiophilus]